MTHAILELFVVNYTNTEYKNERSNELTAIADHASIKKSCDTEASLAQMKHQLALQKKFDAFKYESTKLTIGFLTDATYCIRSTQNSFQLYV
jgi:hypothetical protein